jgi:hypothetical protein
VSQREQRRNTFAASFYGVMLRLREAVLLVRAVGEEVTLDQVRHHRPGGEPAAFRAAPAAVDALDPGP